MPKEKPELSDAMKKKMTGKTFEKNPIKGTKYTIAISSAKGGVGKSTFASNIALVLAKPLGKDPRKIAESIKTELHNSFSDNFDSIEIAGPGFINFKLKKSVLSSS